MKAGTGTQDRIRSLYKQHGIRMGLAAGRDSEPQRFKSWFSFAVGPRENNSTSLSSSFLIYRREQ